ncbi:MAG: hypothetical protein GXP08_18040 [Gammaproteobacteria bacterium]|nr:hypothetical protein [Gammaproteobacteria bacterium]
MKYIGYSLCFAIILLSACDSRISESTITEADREVLEANQEVFAAGIPAALASAIPGVSSVGNVAAGMAVAKLCAKCHGLDGVSARSGAPFIAGFEQDYLIRSMLAYADGSRKHKIMEATVATLSPQDLADVSIYYTQLKTPWKGAIRGEASKQSLRNKKIIAAGKAIAPRCNSCHGPDGNAIKDGLIPSIAGMSMEYFFLALKSYFTGARQHEVMKVFKHSTSDQDIKNLAAYYATRKQKIASHVKKGNPGRGKIAAKICAGCHGYDGNSLNPYMPNLAGQPVEYLVKAIKDYRDGKRHESLMKAPVLHMSNKTITNIAAYYAKQTPHSPLSEDVSTEKGRNPIEDGGRIAASCNSCHGDDGNSEQSGTPNLSGLNVKYLIAATKAYQAGTRQHRLMQKLVSHLSDTDIEKVSYFYATREPVLSIKAPKKGDSAVGLVVSADCVACHGEEGISSDPKTPSLAGQDAAYLVAATRAYASGKRSNETMKSPATAISDKNLWDVAAYYATATPKKPNTFLPEAPEYLIRERCNRCHGQRGFSVVPGTPRLAGQLESYLVVAMQEYQDGTRTSSVMHAMADVLSLLEIKAVAAYYAKQE